MPPSLDEEVTFLSGLNPDGTLAYTSYAAWNPGTNPADYSGGYTLALKWGVTTAGTSGGTVNYYFDPGSSWSEVEKQVFASSLALWSAIANISFALTEDSSAAQILFRRGSDNRAYTDPDSPLPSPPGAGLTDGRILYQLSEALISIDTSQSSFGPITDSFMLQGGAPWMTVIHEIGHAIGLGHAGPYNTSAASSQKFSTYDTLAWSIMTYFGYSTWGTSRATTPMIADILATQRIYGLPENTPLSGGQIFGFNTNIAGDIRPFFDFTVNTRPVITIWNKGRNNTLDLSGFNTASTVSLEPGSFSSVAGLSGNLAIAAGTLIETAIGGSGNDIISANGYGNTLFGGAGDDWLNGARDTTNNHATDRLYGGDGNDTLNGGGNDILNGGNGDDKLVGLLLGSDVASYADATGAISVNLAITTAQNTGSAGNDTLTNIKLVIGSDYDDMLSGSSGATLEGGRGNDLLTGGSGINIASYAHATGGVTVNLGFSGPQAVGGGDGTDTLTNIQGLIGSAYDDVLTGSTGISSLSGGGGNDILTDNHTGFSGSISDGGDGIDTLYLNRTGLTHFSFTPGGTGTSAAYLSDGSRIFQNIEILHLTTASGNGSITFNQPLLYSNTPNSWNGGGAHDTATVDLSLSANRIVAGASGGIYAVTDSTGTLVTLSNIENVIISGGSGNDSLAGGAGNDRLSGGAGTNSLDGGAGEDRAIYASSRATYTLRRGNGGAILVSGDGVSDTLTGIETLTFADRNLAAAALKRPRADLDDDGFSDLVLQHAGGLTELWLLNGSSVKSSYRVDPGSAAWRIAGSADFDADGKSDLALQHDSGLIEVCLMDGSRVKSSYRTNPGSSSWKIIGSDDFDDDGDGDLVLQHDNGTVQIWLMNASSIQETRSLNPGSGWKAMATGDFNGDGKSDLALQNINGQVAIWRTGVSALENVGPVTPLGWNIKATADFNGDGKSDLLLQHGSGAIEIWQMDSWTRTSVLSLNSGGSRWKVTNAGDFDGDGKGDLVLQHDTGVSQVWLMDGGSVKSTYSVDPGSNGWKVAGNAAPQFPYQARADFNGDSRSDMLLANGTGQLDIWILDSANRQLNYGLDTGSSRWQAAAGSDFDGDGQSDVALRHDTGLTEIWLLNGSSVKGSYRVDPGSSSWRIAGAADFNGDGKGDLVLQNDNGLTQVWLMNGASVASFYNVDPGSNNWRMAGTGDVDADGRSDLVLRHENGRIQVWVMNGNSVRETRDLVPSSNWRMVGTGDFDGDRKNDVLLQDTGGTNLPAIWFAGSANLNGVNNTGGPLAAGWRIANTGDFDGDGKSDLLLQNSSGQSQVWIMNGASRQSFYDIAPNPGASWLAASV